ncbi:TRAP transporter substrate-binding protein DctP [bacterium]|nr:TRAP transporter substrate-binding protein DctP [bacterium]
MKMSKFLAAALICLFASCVSAKDKYVLKFATIAPEGTTWMNTLEEMNKEIIAESNGRLKLRIYPGGIMGDELDVLRKMRINQIHGGGFTGVGLGKILPCVRVLDLPYLFNTNNEVDYVDNKMFDFFLKQYDAKGYVLLGWAEAGFVYLFSQFEAKTKDDLKKLKLWAWQDDPIAKAVFEGIGLCTIPLPVTDVLTSLQVGMIDAVYSPPLGALALQWYTRVDYMYSPPITHASGGVLVSKKFVNSLPDDLKKILKDKFKKYLRILNSRSRQDNEKAKEILKKNGIKIISLPDADLEKIKIDAKKVWNNLAGRQYSKELLDTVKNLLKESADAQK